jgi:nitroreductase
MPERISDAELLNPTFVERWSPRAFAPDPVTADELAAVFEAARWSPSWMNNQPWYFLYDTDGPDRQAILDVFIERNRDWARHAPVVGLIVAKTDLEGMMSRSRDFDVGQAAMALNIQATMLGLSMHMLGGIDVDAAQTLIGLDPDVGSVICGFVLGRRGDPSSLHPKLREREHPSSRRPAAEFAIRGVRFPD